MPVMATRASRQLALAANDEAMLSTLGESLFGGHVQVEFEHDRLES